MARSCASRAIRRSIWHRALWNSEQTHDLDPLENHASNHSCRSTSDTTLQARRPHPRDRAVVEHAVKHDDGDYMNSLKVCRETFNGE